MVTTDIKEYSNEELTNLIKQLKSGEAECSIIDLKNLLAQATNRKLPAEYIDTVNNLIHSKIEDEAAPEKRRRGKAFAEDAPAEPAEEEGFPILSFLAGLYKVVAWFCLAASIAAGCVAGFVYFLDEILFAVACVFVGIAAGTILLLVFYAASENISLKLEIERHLREKQ